MENAGGSTTLTSGVAVPVSSGTGEVSAKLPSNVVPFERKGSSAKVAEREAPKQAEKQETAEIIEFAPRKRTNADVADDLFESAKTDGVDKALERFAKDEFDSSHIDNEGVGDESLSDKNSEIEKSPLEGEKKELLPIDVRIANLESRVGELASENKALEKKLAETTELAKSGMLTALELAKILREMIEMEEDEKKKKKAESLLMILTGLIAKMLALMVVPDEHEEDALERIDQAGKAA